MLPRARRARPGEPALGERRRQRRPVRHRRIGDIHEVRAGLHGRDAGLVQLCPSSRVCRARASTRSSRGQQRFEAGHLHAFGFVRSSGRAHIRVVGEDTHPEPCSDARGRCGLSRRSRRCQASLRPARVPGSGCRGRRGLPTRLPHVPLAIARVTREREHLRDRETRLRLRVPRGRAYNRDPTLCCRVEVSVVEVASADGSDPQSGRGAEQFLEGGSRPPRPVRRNPRP